MTINAIASAFSRRPFLWTFVALTVALTTAVFILTPNVADDIFFRANVIQFGTDENGNFDFLKGLVGCWDFRFNVDNARLSNIIAPVLLFVPHILQGLLNGLFFGLMLVLGGRLLPRGASFGTGVTAMCLFVVVLLPWSDHLFTTVFAVNYFWGAVWMLWAISAFLRAGRHSAARFAALGFLCGTWHEGYGMATVAGLGCVWLFFREYRDRARLAMLAGTVLGILRLVFVRGTSIRVESSIIDFDPTTLRFGMPVVIFAALWAILLAVGRWRRVMLSPLMITCVVGAVSEGSLITLVHFPRVIIPALILSIVGLSALIARLRLRRWFRPADAVAAFVIVLHLTAVCYYADVYRRDYGRAIDAYLAPDCNDGVVFIDFTQIEDTHPLALRKPLISELTLGWGDRGLSVIHRREPMIVIPAALRDYRSGAGTPLPGQDGVAVYKGHIVATLPKADSRMFGTITNVRFGDAVIPVETRFMRFAGADSVPHYYVYLNRPLAYTWSGLPDELRFAR